MYSQTDSTLVKLRVKAIKVGNSVRVAIPSEILNVTRIKAGDTLLIDYNEKSGEITLKKEQ